VEFHSHLPSRGRDFLSVCPGPLAPFEQGTGPPFKAPNPPKRPIFPELVLKVGTRNLPGGAFSSGAYIRSVA